jgi:hypothetical protein
MRDAIWEGHLQHGQTFVAGPVVLAGTTYSLTKHMESSQSTEDIAMVGGVGCMTHDRSKAQHSRKLLCLAAPSTWVTAEQLAKDTTHVPHPAVTMYWTCHDFLLWAAGVCVRGWCQGVEADGRQRQAGCTQHYR